MIKNSKNHEVAAVYTKDDQVLVFDASGNTRTSSKNYYIKNSNNVDINGRVVGTEGEVHTHPGTLRGGDNPLGISYAGRETNYQGDSNVAAKYDNHISIIMNHYLYSNINIYDYYQVKYPQGTMIK